MYSRLSSNNHDKVDGSFKSEEAWEDDNGRTLFIVPICDHRITQATRQFDMTSCDEIFGWDYSESEGRAWYGKIHDLVMSFILLNAYPEVYDYIRQYNKSYSKL